MDENVMELMRAANAGKEIKFENMNDLFIHFYEQALDVRRLLEIKVQDPKTHQDRGLKSCWGAELIISAMYIFHLVDKEGRDEKIKKVRSVGLDIFTAVL